MSFLTSVSEVEEGELLKTIPLVGVVRKNIPQNMKTISQNIPELIFCWPYTAGQGLDLVYFVYPQTPLEKPFFPLWVGDHWTQFCGRDGTLGHFPSQFLDPIWFSPVQALWRLHDISEFICVQYLLCLRLCFLSVSSPSALTIFLSPLLHNILSHKERNSMQTPNLEQSV